MRGHANLENNNPDPEQPGNGGNIPQEEAEDWLAPPSGWESWEPRTGIGDSEDVETIVFTATVDASDKGAIAFRLFGDFEQYGVSNYEGRYMNDNNKQNDTSADLYFAECREQAPIVDDDGNKVGTWSGGGPDSTAITASWSKKPMTIVEDEKEMIVIDVKIVCNDFAAYGELQATLEVPGNEPVHSNIHKIPKDGNNNRLADAWDDAIQPDGFVFTQEQLSMDRDESNPSGLNSGDGFTVLEEYRGVVIHDVGDYLTKLAGYEDGYEPDEPSLSDFKDHVRLDPFEKDVFIFSRVGAYKETFSSSDGDYDGGAHNIGYASLPYNLHQIVENDTGTDDSTDFGYRKDRSMNFCYDNMPGVITQRAIGVDVVKGSSSGLGRTRPAPTNPQKLSGCWIYVEQIEMTFNGGEFRNTALNWTIAHEVGHAVGLEHHMGKYDTFNNITYPDAENACAMFTMYGSREGLTKAQIEAAAGSGYADTHSGAPADVHNVPIPGDTDSVWENHGERYELHNNHDDQRSYTDQEGE